MKKGKKKGTEFKLYWLKIEDSEKGISVQLSNGQSRFSFCCVSWLRSKSAFPPGEIQMYFFNNKIANTSLNVIIITTYNLSYNYAQLHS